MRQDRGMLLTHIFQSYFPNGSMIYLLDLPLRRTVSPIKSFLDGNISKSATVFHQIRHKMRKLQYCQKGFDQFNQIGTIIKDKDGLIFIPRKSSSGYIGSYLIVNPSKDFIITNLTSIAPNARKFVNITFTGEFIWQHSNFSKIAIAPYSTSMTFQF